MAAYVCTVGIGHYERGLEVQRHDQAWEEHCIHSTACLEVWEFMVYIVSIRDKGRYAPSASVVCRTRTRKKQKYLPPEVSMKEMLYKFFITLKICVS